jgi:hypothetical protein
MPYLEPVMMIAGGEEKETVDWMEGKKVLMPWMTPKRLVSMILWK